MNIQAALVKSILEQWRSYTWTVQGFGFIRTKIADVGRIHIWDSSLAIARVSTAHTHPWPLHSTIISGELINQRFRIATSDKVGLSYQHQRIQTGEGGGLTGEPEAVQIVPLPPESYWQGDSYKQKPDEIHRSVAQDGTVTLMTRPQGPPLEEASVYWPTGTNWVSAEPKPIEAWRIELVVNYALARWNAECSSTTDRGEPQ